jgi:hypothetical protein
MPSVNDVQAGLTNPESPLNAKPLPRNDEGAFRIENTTTSATVVFSSKRSKGISAKKTFLANLIGHPEFFA